MAREPLSHQHVPRRPHAAGQSLILVILIAALAAVAWASHFPQESDWNTLPSAESLVRLAEADCRKNEFRTGERMGWPLSLLAEARAYQGNHADATEMARSLSSPWNTVAAANNWRIQYEKTGNKAELPAAFDVIDDTFLRFEVATILAIAGQIEEAERILADDEDSRIATTLFIDFYSKLAEAQLRQGSKQSVAASLIRATHFVDQLRYPMTFTRVRDMVRVANCWTKIDELERGKQIVADLEAVIRQRHSAGEATSLLATGVASLAKFWEVNQIHDRADAGFQEALQIAAEELRAQQAEATETSRFYSEHAAETYAKIGKLQFESGRKSEGTATFEVAVSKLAIVEDLKTRNYRATHVAGLWAEAGDFEGVKRFIPQIQIPYYRCKTYCDCGEIAAKTDAAAAKEFLAIALRLCETELEPKDQGFVYSDLGEHFATVGDLDRSRYCFEKAIDAAKKFDPPALAWIARGQVRVGMFGDAFKTIGGISDRSIRLLPFAELALETTKLERTKKE